MRLKQLWLITLLAIANNTFSQNAASLTANKSDKTANSSTIMPADYVNTYIGFRSSNTQITAQVPWGMVSMGPHFVDRYSKDTTKMVIHGFGSMHMSGVGCLQFQSGITLVPTTGDLTYSKKNNGSTFSKEITKPGYYKNTLDKFNITSEMTATERSGIIRFVYPEGKSNLFIDLGNKLSNSHVHWSSFERISDTEFQGNFEEAAFCSGESGHEIYYFIRLNKPAKEYKFFHRGKEVHSEFDEYFGDTLALGLRFDCKKNDTLQVSIGISYCSVINAKLNLETEQNGKTFAQLQKEAERQWNEELSKVIVEGGSNNDKTIFYTGLYHLLLLPSIFSDVNGYYPAMNSREIKKSDFTRYTIFSLWDTYRNVHPMLCLLYPERQIDMVRSIVGMYQDGGWLPKWEQVGRETYNMNGDPSVPVIVDTYLKGLKDFDVNAAYEGMKMQATNIDKGNKLRPGLFQYLKYGYIPNDDKGIYFVPGPASTTMEYAFADWTIARLAESLGKKEDAKEFYRRADFYKNVFDPKTNFFRGRLKNGEFRLPFDTVSWEESYEEGSAWHYNFMVAHDQPGLMKMMGGEKNYLNRLQRLFDTGNFMMGNEPDIAYPYLFNYVKNEEWRTQKTVRSILRKYYTNSSSGMEGDDDCGTMSTWAVCAMMGIYPDCPASNQYVITSPVFQKITIKTNPKYYSGNEFVIEADNSSESNVIIKSMTLNGIKTDNYFLNHSDLVKGGKLKMKLGSK